MKKPVTLLVAFLVTVITFAQNGINYKAIVKDGSGNLVTNQSIGVQFTVLEDAGISYIETHAATTDANGIVILNIGQGTATTSTFDAINWTKTTTLKTEIDLDGGLDNLVDMGTTEFKSVPYALTAGNTAFSTTANVTSNAPGAIDTDDFVFGSTLLAHSAAFDVKDYRMFFDKSKGAFRSGSTQDFAAFPEDGTAWNDTNVGENSFATGFNTIASEFASSAFGFETSASAFASTALGALTTASGPSATAMGDATAASGQVSTAMGKGTLAEAFGSTAMGLYNVGGFVSATATDPLNPLLEIGNGIDDGNRSNALTVLYGGLIIAPSLTTTMIDAEATGKALVTKEYVDGQAGAFSTTANVTSNAPGTVDIDNFVFGSTQLAYSETGFNYDSRMFFDQIKGAFRVGYTENEGFGPPLDGTAWNNANVGANSFASGHNTVASGNYSTAMGSRAMATGPFSFAIGFNAEASGVFSNAIGRSTLAQAFGSSAIGYFNTGGFVSQLNEDPQNKLFEIGNGIIGARSDALTVLVNGTITAPSFDLAEITDPKALVTKEYVDSGAGSSGLEALDEGNGIGWRLIGSDPTHYGNIGFGAVDLSYAYISGDGGATGEVSTAMGDRTTASGDYSTAMGKVTFASGDYSIAMGKNTFASGDYSTAMGNLTTASEDYSTAMGSVTSASGLASTAMGIGAKAESYASTAIGLYNVGGGAAANFPPPASSPLFEIGNGTSDSSRSNAMTVLMSGIIMAPSLDIGEITDPKALVTKEYADTQTSQLEALDEGNGIGWRLKGRDPTNYGNIGLEAIDLSSVDSPSTVFGATGEYSTAMGSLATASGPNSTAMGRLTTAAAPYSTVMGYFTKAESWASTVIGLFNVGGGAAANFPPPASSPLFEIGNGTSDSSRSNAMTITYDGTTTINGATIVNEDSPDANIPAIQGIKTHIGNYDARGVIGNNTVTDWYGIGVEGIGGFQGVRGTVSGTGGNSYYGVYGISTGSNTGTNYGVYGVGAGGTTNYGVYAAGDLVYTGNLVDASDRKLKTNVSAMSNVMSAITLLKPSTYVMKESYQRSMNMSDKPEFGFIAQELQEVFPDLVSNNVHPGETKEAAPIEYLGVNYIGLIPILTKGIQEQQETIDTLEDKVERQDNKIAQQNSIIESLVARMNALESKRD